MAIQNRTMTFDEMLAFEEGWADDALVSSNSDVAEVAAPAPKVEEPAKEAKVVADLPAKEVQPSVAETTSPETKVKIEKKPKRVKPVKSDVLDGGDDDLWQLYNNLLAKGENRSDKAAYIGRIGLTPRVYDAIKKINSKPGLVVNAILEAFLEKYKDRLKEMATKRTDDFKPIF